MKLKKLISVFLMVVVVSWSVFAHKVLLMAELNDDGTVYIQTGLSVGGVPEGAKLLVKDKVTGQPLWKGIVPKSGEITIKRPDSPYDIYLDYGYGHTVNIAGPMPKKKSEDSKNTKKNKRKKRRHEK